MRKSVSPGPTRRRSTLAVAPRAAETRSSRCVTSSLSLTAEPGTGRTKRNSTAANLAAGVSRALGRDSPSGAQYFEASVTIGDPRAFLSLLGDDLPGPSLDYVAMLVISHRWEQAGPRSSSGC